MRIFYICVAWSLVKTVQDEPDPGFISRNCIVVAEDESAAIEMTRPTREQLVEEKRWPFINRKLTMLEETSVTRCLGTADPSVKVQVIEIMGQIKSN